MFKKSLINLAVVLAATQLTGCDLFEEDDKNQAPTDITLSSSVVKENAPGILIGELAAVDADVNDEHEFETQDERFEIEDGKLYLAEGFAANYEDQTSLDVVISVEDDEEAEFSKTLTINVEDVVDTYNFTNGSGESSVSYSGQVARHLLILELNNYINSSLTADLGNGALTSRQAVLDKLMSFYKTTAEDYETVLGEQIFTTTTTPARAQNTLNEISSSKKDLSGKIAGNDATGQHKDWSTEFVAFGEKGTHSPESLIEYYFGLLADNAEQVINGETRQDPYGNDIAVYVTETGLDLKQLIQKTLLGAVTFSQGADDYLDYGIDGKGLYADNTGLVDGKAYTNLEHQFDEGFGYFGATRDYLDFSDEEIAKKGGRDDYQGMHDSNKDGAIDFKSEFIFGHASNAAKRDLGTKDNVEPTDFSTAAMEAFLAGRALITSTNAVALTDEQMDELKVHAYNAVLNWEKAIAATAVHYINDTLDDYADFGTDSFNFADAAKHWSELKGFLISLQFNPHSPLSDADFEEVNMLIGDQLELVAENKAQFETDLKAARTILANAYQFNAENANNW